MSMFSTKYKTTVGTTVKRAVPDEGIPNSPRMGLLRAIFSEGEIAPYVLDEMTQSLAVRGERMYEYARDHYAMGLPSSFAKNSKPQRLAIQAILDALEGQEVEIQYSHVGTPNLLHQGWMRLLESYGYNEGDNTLVMPDAPPDRVTWLVDMYVVFGEAMNGNLDSHSMGQWGTSPKAGYTPEREGQAGVTHELRSHSLPFYDPLLEDEMIELQYMWQIEVDRQDENGQWYKALENQQAKVRFAVDPVDDSADYYHVKYKVDGFTKYWMYKAGDGTYPTLDSLIEFPEQVGEFFPFTYFRFAKTPVSSLTDTPEYNTSKEMLRKLKMDFDEIETNINSNPDIADVEQAMMMFAVPAFTQDQLILRYLCEFFDDMYFVQDEPVQNQYIKIIQNEMTRSGSPTKDMLFLFDKWFRMGLAHGGIFKARKAGTIGKPGTYKLVHESVPVHRKYYGDSESGAPVEYTETTYVSKHRYQKQLTEGLYMEWEVVSLKTIFYIYGEYSAIGNDDEDFLLIPLDRTITTKYNMMDRERLYAMSLHYVFNSRMVTPVKWYESEAFGAIMNAVGFVLIFVGIDTSLLIQGIANAAAAGAWSVVASMVITGIMETIILSQGLKIFVDAIGVEAAAIIALVASALSFMGPSVPFATQLASFGSGLIKAAQEVLKDLGNALQEEADLFGITASIQEKSLQTSQELLEDRGNFMKPFLLFGESPDSYYNRTVHSANIGVLSFDILSNYHTTAKKLPTIDDTLGDLMS